jgi:hypothetical protein
MEYILQQKDVFINCRIIFYCGSWSGLRDDIRLTKIHDLSYV